MDSKAGELNGYPYWGTLAVYSGGGYVVPLEGSKEDLQAKMEQLERENWIDKYTRAVFVEFTVYNAQVNLFAISTILCEFDPSGGTVLSFRFEPAMLLPYMSDAMLFQIVCEIAYMVFTLFFIIREIKSFIKSRMAYFKSFWNLVEIGIIAMSIASIVIFFYRMVVTNGLTKDFKSTNGNGYIKFQYVGYWNEIFSYMIGFLVFFATLKFLKLLRFNRKISMLSATLRHAAKSLLHFGVIFFIVFLAFSQLFYLTYMHVDVDYSTFISSVVATILMMMGKFNIYSMIMTEPVLTQIFVLLFVIMVTFIIVNMFVSILNETFTVVREDVKKQGNDYEVVDFMLQRFKKWTGIGKAVVDDPTTEDPHAPRPGRSDNVEDFPDRIERLLQSISTVYMDNDNLTQLYQKKQYDSRNAKDMLRQGGAPSQMGGARAIGIRKESMPGVPKVHTH
ncbi:polycystic kidney disease protein 1-like 2 [Plakobranchus ocellatus]|uniref:Polycystic kidney disease protein 1-like 2 n=1 Tax=Plakobranchus ocellatus TaxID=259542 RepID=A0AAV4D3L1_9GAST|nr:polycystic kidney disease protein 1-like 2 [Plakobranchus ocellatus]